MFQNVSSKGSSPLSDNPNTQDASDLPAVQTILVRDKLRYFNNGVEVEANGKPIPTSTAGSIDDEVKAHAEGDKKLTEFIDLLLRFVPEIKHILARFLSSLNKTPHADESHKKKLALVISMALEELTSIDKDVLDSIDPQCSDLATRVVRCISGKFLHSRRSDILPSQLKFNGVQCFFDIEIEDFKKALDHVPLSPSLQAKRSPTIKAKSNATTKKRKPVKKEHDNDDNLTSAQLRKRSKASTKKIARQDAEIERPSSKISSDQMNDLYSNNEVLSGIESQEKFSGGTSLGTSSKPMKKRMINELNNSLCEDEPQSKGPHGDLLGVLFSSASDRNETAIAIAGQSKQSSAEEGTCCEASKKPGLVNCADESKMSAANLLLGLGK